jgi:hypothetical protein
MKKFIGKVLILGAFFIPFAFIFPAVLDPYNVFHYKNIRDNGVGPNQNYIKMRYLLDNPDKFDSFVVGSSKVGFIDVDRINPGRWYNMTHGWGTPKEYYENLRVLMENGIVPATVLLGIDTASGWLDPEINAHSLGGKPYPVETKFPMDQTTGKLRYAHFLISKGIIPRPLGRFNWGCGGFVPPHTQSFQ